MRQAFIGRLCKLAAEDRRIVLLTGDLGFMVLEPFVAAHPDRFVNVGVAEGNMMGIAAGMASQGMIPFCYSIATFASMRGYEQFRDGAVLHHLPVRVVAVGGGYGYGSAGISHHALEDIALMRAQPGVTVAVPVDDRQAVAALDATWSAREPIYYRLSKDSFDIHGIGGQFKPGTMEILNTDGEIAIISSGPVTAMAVAAAEVLKTEGSAIRMGVVSCLRPAPSDDLVALLAGTRAAVTVEDHYVDGGLGSLVAETIAEAGLPVRLTRLGVRNPPDGVTGSEQFLLARNGISVEAIAGALRAALNTS